MVFGLAAAIAAVASCSSGRDRDGNAGNATAPSDGPGESGAGSVGIRFTLPGSTEHFSSFTYDLTNGAHDYSAKVNVGSTSTVSFVIGGVQAGAGYSITLVGQSDDYGTVVGGIVQKGITCQGSFGTGVSDAGQNNGAPFAVVDRQSTIVNVQLICTDDPNANQGGLLVNGIPSCCPTWDTLVANPQGPLAVAAPGNTTTLTANASAPCDGDAGGHLSCVWSIKSGAGTVTATSADGAGNFASTFTCPMGTTEADVVQLDCTDGALPDGGFCPAALTHGELYIACGPKTTCGGPAELGVVASPDSPLGTCTGTDPMTGKPLVNTGMPDAYGDFCCVPAPACSAGHLASPVNGSGSCAAYPGTVNDRTGCCVAPSQCVGPYLPTATTPCTGTDPVSGNPLVNSGIPYGPNPPGVTFVSVDGFCCVAACGGGPVASPFSPTGSCLAYPYTYNNGSGCCTAVGLHPCTQVGDTNCVQCQFNPFPDPPNVTAPNLCTPTEARLVQHDIDKGRVALPGPDPVGSCYHGAGSFSCIDDTLFSDGPFECGDHTYVHGTEAQCLAVVDCVLASSCATIEAVDCLCGPNSHGGCTVPPTGACADPIAAAFGFPVSDPGDIVMRFGDVTYAGGQADRMFGCLVNNQVLPCLD
jgi:hypothetical protein